MDEKVKKKGSKTDRSNSGNSFELELNEGKKKKHKERKKKHGDGEILNSTEALEENFTGEAAEGQTCSVEGNIAFSGEAKSLKIKKKKGRKDTEVISSNIADDKEKEMQFLDDSQQSKVKKRKNSDDSLAGTQEMGASKPSKKSKMTGDNEFENNEGYPPLDIITSGDANAHSLVNEVDYQGKKMKKKKRHDGCERTEKGYKSGEGDHSVVTEEGQGKEMKMEKILSKKNKRTEDDEGDPSLAKSNIVDPPLVNSNEGDQYLVKNNEGEDDELGKKMKEKEKKKKKKKKKLSEKSKHKENDEFKSNEGGQHLAKSSEGEDDEKGKKMKKKKKKLSEKRKYEKNNEFKSNEGDQDFADSNEGEGEDDDQGKKMKKKKKLSGKRESKENNDFKSNEGNSPLARFESGDANESCIVTEFDDQGKKMKVKKKTKASTGESPNPADGATSKPKRVTFSDQVEICCDNLVRGKRFTPEEDEKIEEAVLSYIESHGLGDEGLDMVLHCRSHPEVRDCWKEIGAALPHRPHHSVYYRAHILFERDEKRRWTPEELEFVRKVQEQHGSDWKSIAEALGKNRFHVKDAWRRIKQTNTNKGRWSQEEYQKLFDLVNLDLRARALQEFKKTKHGMLRDNISWEAIGSKLGTRTSARCCKKWYEQLTSPMVAHGVWSDTDDYRLINALYILDACCMEEVEWDNLLEHRDGDVCRKRWNQMVQYIGVRGSKSFAEQVEILAKRFCPDLLEAREAFDSKPVVC